MRFPAVDRTILITGASSGIGLAAATIMAGRGWQVFATVRREEDRQRLALLPGVTPLLMDYADPASIAATAEAVLEATGGRLGALYNNGAYGQPGALEDISTEVLRQVFEVNVLGWHDLTRRLIPAMRRAGAGRIVMCSSILGFLSMPYRGAYNASKHAIEGLADSWRLELIDAGIHVATLQPGPIATNFVATSMKQFRDNVDVEGSANAAGYRQRLDDMQRPPEASVFRKPPEAVVDCLVHACESARPRPYYRITWLTKGAAVVKHLLPASLFVALLHRAAKDGN